jgi:hypothetical protein
MGRDEVLALDDGEQFEHARIQHIPGADLLLDHVEAGLFDVHGRDAMRTGSLFRRAGRDRGGAADRSATPAAAPPSDPGRRGSSRRPARPTRVSSDEVITPPITA